eukprot:451809_1
MSHSVVNISQSIDNDNKSDEKIDYLNLVQIKCKCEESNLDEDELYICKYKECNDDFYCADCGPYYHNFISKKKRKNHRFQLEGLKNNENILALSQLLTKEQDITKFNMAQKQLIALIGVKKYNQIKTYIEKPIVLVSSNLPMAIQLGYELQEFFKSVQEAVMAHKAAQNATTAASHALTAYDEAPEIIWQRWFTWDYNVEWDYILNPEKANLKSNLELATAVEADRLKKANDALNGTVSIKKAMKVGAIGMAIATTIEMGIHAYRWKTGQISGKEWCRLLGRSLVKNTASMVGTAVGGQGGAILGCKLGVSIGTAINPVLGTMVGGVVGVVGGILFGYLMGKGAEAVYDQVFSEIKSEEKQKEKLLQEALLYFNFQPKDIRNSKIFNEKRLKTIFKQRALFAHPDRRDGDHSEWYRLSTYYGYLKALLEQNETNKEMVEKSMEKMQALQYN